jgi:hypothetical protein
LLTGEELPCKLMLVFGLTGVALATIHACVKGTHFDLLPKLKTLKIFIITVKLIFSL